MSIKKTIEEFIKQSIKVHGNKYDYSLSIYVTSKIKVKIICLEHGVFEQTPDQHLQGYGCNKCNGGIKLTKTEIIKNFKNSHNNKYNYSLVNYKNSHTKVKIICTEHGVFEQTPNSHKRGNGCPKCAGKQKTISEIINDFSKIHGNRYDYSLVKYKKSNEKVNIICTEHGTFKQTVSKHLNNQGCPICRESKGEKEIRKLLESKNINYISQKTFQGCKYKKHLPFDFYLPKYNMCIEFDGEQHFIPKKHFGGLNGLQKIQKRDNIKNIFCDKNNIKLLRIKFDDKIIETLKNYL